MRFVVRRALMCVALLVGVVSLAHNPVDALAAEVPPDDFKAIFEQDAKNVQSLIAAGKFAARDVKAITCNSMMIALYAQSKIKGGPDDKKFATIRDNALKVAESMAKGKATFKDAAEPAKGLDLAAAAGTADVKPIKLAGKAKFDIDALMHQFKKTSVAGLNVEDDIKTLSKKYTAADAKKVSAIAARVLFVAEYEEDITADFAGAKKTKKAWGDYNKAMRDAATDLQATLKSSPTDVKKVMTGLTKLDGSCNACHETFK